MFLINILKNNKNNSPKYFGKLFNGGNNAALNYHVSTRYKTLSAPSFEYSRSAPELFSEINVLSETKGK